MALFKDVYIKSFKVVVEVVVEVELNRPKD